MRGIQSLAIVVQECHGIPGHLLTGSFRDRPPFDVNIRRRILKRTPTTGRCISQLPNRPADICFAEFAMQGSGKGAYVV